jgi:hypothetical protein
MKKFYIPIFTVLFLLISSLSKAQTTYTSISSNPNHYTLDDPRYWGGAPTDITAVPPNICNNCILKIYSDVTVVPHNGALAANGGVGTTSQVPGADDISLDHITLQNSTVNLYGATTLSINTYLTLQGSSITIGNNPTSLESILVSDQVDMDQASGIQLANDQTVINVTNPAGKTNILGPHEEIGNPGFIDAGIYGLLSAPLSGGSALYTMILEENGLGSDAPGGEFFGSGGVTYYTFNCSPTVVGAPHACNFGLIWGPAVTQAVDPTFGVLFGQSTTLPVQLAQFLALKNGDGSVKLLWSTSQEVNAGYYDVERSGDQTSFTKIGSVKALGNSSTTTNYSFVDKLPVDGTGYYRLKMVDLDGKFKYSKTIAVTVENDERPLVIYSNPFSDMIRMKVNVPRAQSLTITVSDMLGKTYINQEYHAQNGDNLVNLPSSISNHGVYVMRIYGESYDQTVKLQKQ